MNYVLKSLTYDKETKKWKLVYVAQSIVNDVITYGQSYIYYLYADSTPIYIAEEITTTGYDIGGKQKIRILDVA
jgi:hypothetical protein